jgi:hypothetical protein
MRIKASKLAIAIALVGPLAVAAAGESFAASVASGAVVQAAHSLIKGFWSERLDGAAPRVVRIMSMRARNVAGTCRLPG